MKMNYFFGDRYGCCSVIKGGKAPIYGGFSGVDEDVRCFLSGYFSIVISGHGCFSIVGGIHG